MTQEQLARLRALEQHMEAMALGFAALRQQVTALVSEAEHGEQIKLAERADPEPPPSPPGEQFYNMGSDTPTETPTDAPAFTRRARRRPSP